MYDDVRFKKIHPDAILPTRAHRTDAGLDLHAISDAVVYTGDGPTMIGTGIAVAIPEHLVGLVCSRSGLATRGVFVTNAPGVIDSGYRGEIKVILSSLSHRSWVRIEKGERIAQLLFTPVALPTLRFVDELDDTDRGDDGFGSSGRFTATVDAVVES